VFYCLQGTERPTNLNKKNYMKTYQGLDALKINFSLIFKFITNPQTYSKQKIVIIYEDIPKTHKNQIFNRANLRGF
jgi:hypothetical protein